MKPTEQATQCYDQMAIVEKYERVIAYLYPIAQSVPRKVKFIASWSGHAKWADTNNLFTWLEKKHGITI